MLAQTTELVVDTSEFANFMMHAKAGTRCCYHVGALARDRHEDKSKLSPANRLRVDELANMVSKAAADGIVNLFQRREGTGDNERYVYFADRTGARWHF